MYIVQYKKIKKTIKYKDYMYIYLCTLYYKLSQVSLSLTGIFQIHVNKMSIHMYLRSGTLVQTTHILLVCIHGGTLMVV